MSAKPKLHQKYEVLSPLCEELTAVHERSCPITHNDDVFNLEYKAMLAKAEALAGGIAALYPKANAELLQRWADFVNWAEPKEETPVEPS